MVRKIQDIAAERDDVVEQVAQYQDENDALKREKDRLYLENCDVNEAKTEVENTLLGCLAKKYKFLTWHKPKNYEKWRVMTSW